ncbi:hypothetical protein BSKO_06942 [Bryopsis sp. KO-2023]|nr:hypothetical protein BSKO_06942 [Bryopsis sp. KO-2023]
MATVFCRFSTRCFAQAVKRNSRKSKKKTPVQDLPTSERKRKILEKRLQNKSSSNKLKSKPPTAAPQDDVAPSKLPSSESARKSPSKKREVEFVDEVDPELIELLEGLGIEKENVQNLVEKAQIWWRETGSERGGKLNPRLRDFRIDNAENVLEFLCATGVPIRDLGSIVENCPEILIAEVQDELAPLVRLLEGLKIKGRALVRIIVDSPQLLMTGNWKKVATVIEVLKRLQIHETQICKMVCREPGILQLSLQELQRNTQQLVDLIAMQDDLLMMVTSYPCVFCRPTEMLKGVEEATEAVGLSDSDVRGCIQLEAKLLINDPSKLKQNVELLLTQLTESDTAQLIKKYPKILTRRTSNLRSKLDILSKVSGRRIGEDLLDCPQYFDYSISGWIGPRFMYLKSKRPEALENTRLSLIINRGDAHFAKNVAGTMVEEFTLFKEQWSKIHGGKYNFYGPGK